MQTKEKFNFSINFRPIFLCFVALLVGLISARKLYSGDGTYIATVVILFVIIVAYSLFKRKIVGLIIAILCFFVGNGMYFLSYSSFMGKEYNSSQICGRVSEVEEQNSLLALSLQDVTANGQKVSGVKLYVYSAEENSFSVGDVIVYVGDLRHQQMFSLGSFNSYYYRDKIAYSSSAMLSDISVTSSGMRFDEQAREKIKETLYSNMDERYASVAYSVLTGSKDGIDGEIYAYFKDSGIVHLLAVSGLHVTMLITVIAFLLKKVHLNKYASFALMFIVLMLYAYICGFTPTIVRATIMGLMLSLAVLSNKRYDGLTAIGFAGTLTLFIFPLSAFDVGFLMSYSCVIGIYLLNKPICKILSKFIPRKVASLLSISLSAQIGILPALSSLRGKLNLLGAITNLIVIPLFSVLFPLLVLSTIIVLIFPSLGPLLKASEWGFYAIEQVAIFFSSTSLKIRLRKFDSFYVTIFMMIIFAASYYLMSSALSKWLVILMLTLVFGLYTFIKPGLYDRGSSVYIFGYDSSPVMVLESKSGQTFCVNYNARFMEAFLDNENFEKIDFVLSSTSLDEFADKTLIDKQGFAGDFKYSQKGDDFTIEFDGAKIFFTNTIVESYNNFKSDEMYDFAFAKDSLTKINAKFVATQNLTNLSNYSLHQSGALKYSLSANKVWRID